ncbi:MAG TPA: phosphate ABC transporter substrate-binding protein PstS [Balneolales bacterium]|nr:phosphate ABC transporter substrate-binding protein PstS [Balneolales bacterium]
MKFKYQQLSSLFFAVAIALMFTMTACGNSKKSNDKTESSTTKTSQNEKAQNSSDAKHIMGAGSTFAYPIYTKMFDVYHKETGIQVNYQGIGSGGGIRQLESKIIDFGGSDAPLSDKDEQNAPAFIVHIPTCLGAVTMSYNLPGNPHLRFTSDVIADIYLGKIKKWNNPRIEKLNPGVKLPNMAITVVHRSDGSGTTYIFSDYLTKVSSAWSNKVGRGKSLDWPVGLGGKGNPGVAGIIKNTPGSLGYVELIYTLQNNMPVAKLKNKSGNYIKPTLQSTSLAANVKIPADARVSLTNTDAKEGYPIAGFTWVLLYKQQKYNGRSEAQAKSLVNLVWWMIHDGQKFTKPLRYAPLPDAAVKVAENILESVKYGNQSLLQNK